MRADGYHRNENRPPWWMRQPEGERYPCPPGRRCADCEKELSRYNDGEHCWACLPAEARLQVEAAS